MDAKPVNRDIIRGMYEAFKKQGLEFGVYYSHNFDWRDGTDDRAFETITKNLYDGHPDKAIGANIWDPFPNTYEESLLNKTFPKMKLLRVEKKNCRFRWFSRRASCSRMLY